MIIEILLAAYYTVRIGTDTSKGGPFGVLRWVRRWARVTDCAYCMAIWAGLVWAGVALIADWAVLRWALLGFAGAGAVALIYDILSVVSRDSD